MFGQILMNCNEFEVDGLVVPAFQVFLGEVVAVVHSLEEGGSRINLMALLSGVIATMDVTVYCKSCVADPFRVGGALDRPVSTLHHARGLAATEWEEVVAAAGVDPDSSYRDVQLTTKVVIEMKVSRMCGVQLMLLSTGGLDPLGVERVLNEARNCKDKCASLAFFHKTLATYYESTGLLGRLCDRLICLNKRRGGPTGSAPA